MKIIVSPAKGFKGDVSDNVTKPLLTDESMVIMDQLQRMSEDELRKTMRISSQLAELNFERYQNFSFTENLTPAILSFDGMAYRVMDVNSLDRGSRDYLCKNLYILSGLYGILRACDGIQPYRLDFADRVKVNNMSLKKFWGDKVYRKMSEDDNDVIVNLASKEYSNLIIPYIEGETCITCSFKVERDGKERVMSTWSKKGRGLMTRFMAENRIEDYTELKSFTGEGFSFHHEEVSDDGKLIEYVFKRIEYIDI